MMMCLKLFILNILLNLSFAVNFDECGVSNIGHGFSVGGNYSKEGEWPWLAPIYLRENFYCGSSIISKKHLLSAAHCVQPKGQDRPHQTKDYNAFLGAHDLNEKSKPGTVQVHFSNIYIHNDWNASRTNIKYDADIALFMMTSAIEYSTLIQPICLPNAESTFDHGLVAGYGLSETSQRHENLPKHVELKVTANDVCLYSEQIFVKIGSLRMFCAGERGKNPCRGDSGGPFMVKDSNHWTVNGIVSVAAKDKCDENDFVLFTRVSLFVGWINEKIKADEENLDLKCKITGSECKSYTFKVLQPNLKVTSITPLEPNDYSKAEWLWIENAEVRYLPDFSIATSKLSNFKRLAVINSKLKRVDRSQLARLPHLVELNLHWNDITELSEDVFNDLTNLEVFLCLDGVKMKTFPQKLLWKLPKLKSFGSSEGQLETIPARFFEKNKNLKIVWLRLNKLTRIEIDLKSLPKLKHLNLAGNACIDKVYDVKGNWGGLPDIDEFQNLIDDKCA